MRALSRKPTNVGTLNVQLVMILTRVRQWESTDDRD